MADQTDTTRRSFLRGLPLAGIAASMPALAFNTDGNLVRLGNMLDAAWTEERRLIAMEGRIDQAEIDLAIDKSAELIDRIRNCRATSLDGFRVKAKALSWCNGGNFDVYGNGKDNRIVAGIVNDLLRVA